MMQIRIMRSAGVMARIHVSTLTLLSSHGGGRMPRNRVRSREGATLSRQRSSDDYPAGEGAQARRQAFTIRQPRPVAIRIGGAAKKPFLVARRVRRPYMATAARA